MRDFSLLHCSIANMIERYICTHVEGWGFVSIYVAKTLHHDLWGDLLRNLQDTPLSLPWSVS